MTSHVGGRKMQLSKLLFIALVALYVVFARVSANDGDEIAVEAEGEGAPGAVAVEGDIGESQAGADLVRSQLVSTRAGSGSVGPTKKAKPSKLKIAIIIGLILVVLAIIAAATGFFIIRPMVAKKRDEKMIERMGGGLTGEYSYKKEKLGDDKRDRVYFRGPAELDAAKLAEVKANRDKLAASDIVKKGKDGKIYFDTKGKAVQDKIVALFGGTLAKSDDKNDNVFAAFLGSKVLGGDYACVAEGKGWTFVDLSKKGKKDEKKDNKDK